MIQMLSEGRSMVVMRAVRDAPTLNKLPMMDRIMIAKTETTILDKQR